MKTHESDVEKARNFVNQRLNLLESTDHSRRRDVNLRGPYVKTRHERHKPGNI